MMTKAQKNEIVTRTQSIIARGVARAFRAYGLRDSEAISDAVNDAIVRLLSNALDTFDHGRGVIEAFVATVAYNQGIDCARKCIFRSRFQSRYVDGYQINNVAAPFVPMEAPLIEQEKARSMCRALFMLSAKDRDIFNTLNNDRSRQSAVKLAKRTKMTINHLRVRMHRLRKRLAVETCVE